MAKRRVRNIGDDDVVFYTEEEDGESLVTVLARTFGASKQPASTVATRLLSDIQAASYLGVSRSAVRALVANGDLRRIVLPSTNGRGQAARLLRIDLKDLDRFIEKSKG